MRKILSIFAFFSLLLPCSALAEAVFNPHFIISDEELQKCDGWTSSNVQNFLTSKGSYLANYRDVDIDGTIKSAAEIIYNASIRNQISPKFLLVTLQKEQSLITDDKPSQRQLDWATGFAVCDGCELASPKVQKYKGFAKQVDGSAGIMRWYYENTGHGVVKKKDSPVYIDNQPVVPQSWATAFLYTYTPHLHGNQNFWRIWNNWFAQFYPNGTIVKSASTSDYYLIQDGKKRRFSNMTALISRADPKTAVIMNSVDLDNYPDGASVSFSNYSILKSPSAIYLLDYDTLRPFASAEIVRQIGYNPQEFIEVSESDISGYARGPAITVASAAPQGVIYKISDLDNAYYLFKDNILYPIADAGIVSANYKNLSVETKKKTDIAKYEVANEPVKYADGTLLKIKDSVKIYVMESGKKRRISDEETFYAMGYNKENLHTISLVSALNIPDGEPIYVNNSLASSADKYLGDSEAPVDDLFKTKLPAYLVAEYPSGKILSGKNVDEQRPIASLTKILTVYEGLQNDLNLGKSTAYSSKKYASYGNPLKLIDGEKITNKDLIFSTLVASVNNTSRMIAGACNLTENALITSANKRLKDWGADSTFIADTTGLSDKNVSTPRDLLKVFVKALKQPTIKEALSQVDYSFKESLNKNGVSKHYLQNTNTLMQNSKKPYRILASKTGYTDEAGAVLVMLVESKTTKKQFVVITMGNSDSASRFTEPNRMAEWTIKSAATIASVK